MASRESPRPLAASPRFRRIEDARAMASLWDAEAYANRLVDGLFQAYADYQREGLSNASSDDGGDGVIQRGDKEN